MCQAIQIYSGGCAFVWFIDLTQTAQTVILSPHFTISLISSWKLKLHYDRQSVGQSVLVPNPRQFFILLEIFFRRLRVYFVALSLTRGRACNLLLLLVLASAVPLGSESRGTQNQILLSQFLKLSQPGGTGPRIYIPQEECGPDIPPGTGFPFRRLLRLAGSEGDILSASTRDPSLIPNVNTSHKKHNTTMLSFFIAYISWQIL
jgi:hypothetical protein